MQKDKSTKPIKCSKSRSVSQIYESHKLAYLGLTLDQFHVHSIPFLLRLSIYDFYEGIYPDNKLDEAFKTIAVQPRLPLPGAPSGCGVALSALQKPQLYGP